MTKKQFKRGKATEAREREREKAILLSRSLAFTSSGSESYYRLIVSSSSFASKLSEPSNTNSTSSSEVSSRGG